MTRGDGGPGLGPGSLGPGGNIFAALFGLCPLIISRIIIAIPGLLPMFPDAICAARLPFPPGLLLAPLTTQTTAICSRSK